MAPESAGLRKKPEMSFKTVAQQNLCLRDGRLSTAEQIRPKKAKNTGKWRKRAPEMTEKG